MTSPSVVSTATTDGTSGVVNPTVNLPGSLVLGNTVTVYLRKNAQAGNAFTWPAGWNEFFASDADASDDRFAGGWWKVDDDAATTVQIDGTGLGKFCAVSKQFSGAADPDVSPPEAATVTSGTGTQPDPGTVTPTGGSKDYYFDAVASQEGESSRTPTYPTGYNDNQIDGSSQTAGSTSTNSRVAAGGKQATASSDDPGVFTYDTSDDWMATTVAIHPAAGGGPVDTPKTVTAYIKFAKSVAKANSKSRTAYLKFAMSLTTLKSALVTLTAHLKFARNRTNAVGKPRTAYLKFSRTLTKAITPRAKTAFIKFAGTLTTLKSALVTLTAYIKFARTRTNAVGKPLNAYLKFGRALTKSVGWTRTAYIKFAATLTTGLALSKVLTAYLHFGNTLTRNTGKPLTARLKFANSLTKAVSISRVAYLRFRATLTRASSVVINIARFIARDAVTVAYAARDALVSVWTPLGVVRTVWAVRDNRAAAWTARDSMAATWTASDGPVA